VSYTETIAHSIPSVVDDLEVCIHKAYDNLDAGGYVLNLRPKGVMKKAYKHYAEVL
jgi:hypothetical protein